MSIKKIKNTALISLFALLLTATIAQAHAAIVWAYVENSQVFVEAFFANGKKMQNCRVVVLDGDEKIIQEGKTNTEGKFNYTPKSLKTQTIVVVASKSHSGNFELSEEDLAVINEPKKK